MYTFSGLLAVFVLLLCNHVIAKIIWNNDLEALSKNWTTVRSSGIRFRQGKLITEDTTIFLFASCKYIKAESNELCNVTLETWASAQANTKSNCFNVEIRSISGDEFMELELYRLTNSKILMSSTELLKNKIDYETNYSILDMNRCDVIANIKHSAKYDENLPFVIHPILYQNSFKVVSNSKERCKGIVSCILTYDFDGKEVDELKSFKSDVNYLTMSVSKKLSDEGFYTYSVRKFNGSIIWNVNYFEDPSTEFKELMSESIDMWPKRVAHSNAHGFYSLCWLQFVESNQLQCRQFDNQAAKLNLTFELPSPAHLVAVQNLADGGILVATGSCKSNSNFLLTDYNCAGIRIQKFTADGEKYRPVEIPNGFKSKNAYLLHLGVFQVEIFENIKDEFCFLWAWLERSHESNVDVLKYKNWCIPKELTVIQY